MTRATAARKSGKSMKSTTVTALAASPLPVKAVTPKICVIASGKGGSQKTTTSLNLATIAAAQGLKVLLVDTDDQPSLSRWWAKRQKQEEVVHIDLITVPLEDIKRAFTEIGRRPGIELVIIDTPPGLSNRIRIRELLAKADFVLVPTGQDTADLESVSDFMKITQALTVPSAFLLSRTNQRWSDYRLAKHALMKLGVLCPVDVRDLRDIAATHTYGLGINEFSGARGADDMAAVWDFVRNSMGLG
jgi:chromosome partitioning protein